MCLDRVDETYTHPSDLIVDGWKQFGVSYPGSYLRFTRFGGDVQMDTWLAAEVKWGHHIDASDGKRYTPGFHVYTNQEKGTRRVYLRRIGCAGQQNGKSVAVAQEMYVPSDPDGWPPKTISAPPGPPSPPTPGLVERVKRRVSKKKPGGA